MKKKPYVGFPNIYHLQGVNCNKVRTERDHLEPMGEHYVKNLPFPKIEKLRRLPTCKVGLRGNTYAPTLTWKELRNSTLSKTINEHDIPEIIYVSYTKSRKKDTNICSTICLLLGNSLQDNWDRALLTSIQSTICGLFLYVIRTKAEPCLIACVRKQKYHQIVLSNVIQERIFAFWLQYKEVEKTFHQHVNWQRFMLVRANGSATYLDKNGDLRGATDTQVICRFDRY